MKNSAWTTQEIEFLKENYKTMTNAEMALCLDRTKTAVDLKINRLGIKKSKYIYNHSYFEEIDSSDKAYWLGFIAADGYIMYNPITEEANYELGIEIDYKDKNLLKLFNKSIGGNIEVRDRKRPSYYNPNKVAHNAFIRIYSKKVVTDLMTHGIFQNKSTSIQFITLSDELMPHFVRGYFDGNGSVSCDVRKKRTLACSFSSGSKDFLEGLRSFLYKNDIYSYIHQEKEHCFRLHIKGIKNCTKFLDLIYRDRQNLFLRRKYNRACELFTEFDYARRLPLCSEMGSFLN